MWKRESASRLFQPGEGPSRGLLRDCEIFGNIPITFVSSTISYSLQPLPDTIGPTARPALKHHEYGQCTNSVVKRSLFMYLFRYWIELNLIISILNQWRGKIFYCFVEILACFWTILERVFIFLCSVKKKVNRFISKTCFPLKCTRCSKFQSV